MSNKLEAALGGLTETEIEADRNAAESRKPNRFTDAEGETYSGMSGVSFSGKHTIIVETSADQSLVFYKDDATKIIALIAEAAGSAPTWDSVNAQIDSLLAAEQVVGP